MSKFRKMSQALPQQLDDLDDEERMSLMEDIERFVDALNSGRLSPDDRQAAWDAIGRKERGLDILHGDDLSMVASKHEPAIMEDYIASLGRGRLQHDLHRIDEILERRPNAALELARDKILACLERRGFHGDGETWGHESVESGRMGDALIRGLSSLGIPMRDSHRDMAAQAGRMRTDLPSSPVSSLESPGSPGFDMTRRASGGRESSISRFGDVSIHTSNPAMTVVDRGVAVGSRGSVDAGRDEERSRRESRTGGGKFRRMAEGGRPVLPEGGYHTDQKMPDWVLRNTYRGSLGGHTDESQVQMNVIDPWKRQETQMRTGPDSRWQRSSPENSLHALHSRLWEVDRQLRNPVGLSPQQIQALHAEKLQIMGHGKVERYEGGMGGGATTEGLARYYGQNIDPSRASSSTLPWGPEAKAEILRRMHLAGTDSSMSRFGDMSPGDMNEFMSQDNAATRLMRPAYDANREMRQGLLDAGVSGNQLSGRDGIEALRKMYDEWQRQRKERHWQDPQPQGTNWWDKLSWDNPVMRALAPERSRERGRKYDPVVGGLARYERESPDVFWGRLRDMWRGHEGEEYVVGNGAPHWERRQAGSRMGDVSASRIDSPMNRFAVMNELLADPELSIAQRASLRHLLSASDPRFVRMRNEIEDSDACEKCNGSGTFVGGHFTEESPGRCWTCDGTGKRKAERRASLEHGDLAVQCAWCNAIRRGGEWHPHHEKLDRATHRMCPSCKVVMEEELAAMRSDSCREAMLDGSRGRGHSSRMLVAELLGDHTNADWRLEGRGGEASGIVSYVCPETGRVSKMTDVQYVDQLVPGSSDEVRCLDCGGSHVVDVDFEPFGEVLGSRIDSSIPTSNRFAGVDDEEEWFDEDRERWDESVPDMTGWANEAEERGRRSDPRAARVLPGMRRFGDEGLRVDERMMFMLANRLNGAEDRETRDELVRFIRSLGLEPHRSEGGIWGVHPREERMGRSARFFCEDELRAWGREDEWRSNLSEAGVRDPAEQRRVMFETFDSTDSPWRRFVPAGGDDEGGKKEEDDRGGMRREIRLRASSLAGLARVLRGVGREEEAERIISSM